MWTLAPEGCLLLAEARTPRKLRHSDQKAGSLVSWLPQCSPLRVQSLEKPGKCCAVGDFQSKIDQLLMIKLGVIKQQYIRHHCSGSCLCYVFFNEALN